MDNKLKRNIIYNALYEVFMILLPIATTPYLVRVLSADQIGINSYTLSIVQIFIIISACGMKNHASREFAIIKDKKNMNEEFWSIWIIQIIFSILSFISLNLLNIYVFNDNNSIFFIQSFLVLINMLEVSWFFIGIEELQKVVIRNTIIKLLMTCCIFIFIKNPTDFYLYVLINVITSFFGNIVLASYLRQYIGKPNINKSRVIYHISKSWKFLIPQFSILIYTSIDKVILGNLSNMVEVAYYDQSQKIIRIAVSLISSVGISLLPRMSYLSENNKKEEFDYLLTKSLNAVSLISIYISTVIICTAPDFVGWFFSEEYRDIALLIQIVSPIGIFIPIATILWNTVLIPNKLDNIAIKSAVYCAIISVILNCLLDKKLGALGAIISLLLVECYGMLYRVYYSKKYYDFSLIITSIKKYILASILTFICIIPANSLMKGNIISTIIIAIITSLVYLVILILIKDKFILNYLENVKLNRVKLYCIRTYKKLKNILKNTINDNQIITINYIRNFKTIPNIKNPKTFAEKIHFIKCSDWLEDKSDFVDKYKVREFVKNNIGEEYLIKLLGVYETPEQIEFNKLPQSFVLKLNNGSGYNLIVKDKNKINELEVKSLLNEWLESDFYRVTREKQYKNVQQLLVIEEYLEDDSRELRDYKFFCFNGKFEFVQVDTGRFSNHIQNFYDEEWNKLDFTYICEKNNFIDKKPEKYNEMIDLAQKLSNKFPFVRVDFYYVNNRIYFGELTFTPNNGMKSIKPIEKDLEIAKLIDIRQYIDMKYVCS